MSAAEQPGALDGPPGGPSVTTPQRAAGGLSGVGDEHRSSDGGEPPSGVGDEHPSLGGVLEGQPPELIVGGAFLGGMVAALMLRRLLR